MVYVHIEADEASHPSHLMHISHIYQQLPKELPIREKGHAE